MVLDTFSDPVYSCEISMSCYSDFGWVIKKASKLGDYYNIYTTRDQAATQIEQGANRNEVKESRNSDKS